MGIDNSFLWYQQKIATYDKQKWETRIEQREQRIIGLNHIRMRSTKPNTDLIDLDLVRGSSFTKAKPQHGFLTVAKLATLRHALLPFYWKWWIQQTSRNIFVLIFILYMTQLIPLVVYTFFNVSQLQNVSSMELIVPIIMMWILSLIHSQIVATNHGLDGKSSDCTSRQYRRRRHHVRHLRGKEKLNAASDNSTNSVKCKKLKFNEVVHVANAQRNRSQPNLVLNPQHEDDGFESLTGNGSRTSEEEVPIVLNQVNKIDSKIIEEESDKRHLNADVEIDEEGSNCSSCKKCKSWIRQVNEVKFNKPRVVSTDSESDKESDCKQPKLQGKKKNCRIPTISINALDSEDELLSTADGGSHILNEDMMSSANEWSGMIGDDCTITDTDTDDVGDVNSADYISMDYDSDLAPTGILNPTSIKVSCVIWESHELKKADLSMLDISSAIIGKVESMTDNRDYFYVGLVISTLLAFLPVICLFSNCNSDVIGANNNQLSVSDLFRNISDQLHSNNAFEIYKNVGSEMLNNVLMVTHEISVFERCIIVIALFQRWILAAMLFFLLSVAERTFKQRLLYAKLFSHLTSSRRARKSELPHFRLNKVQNIKTWLSVRSYLKKRGPQRSVDVIVSTSFVVCLLLLIFLCFELLKETINFSQYYLEALIWCLGLGVFLLRFMTLGTKINKKYRNLSVLIMEQINLHLKIEQKPHKKEELNVANNVLKLAIDLLKELESPFKISGLSANPILYNVTKLIILSALSGVLSEMLGFKLKLHKIKLK